jgi:hypothetical protein
MILTQDGLDLIYLLALELFRLPLLLKREHTHTLRATRVPSDLGQGARSERHYLYKENTFESMLCTYILTRHRNIISSDVLLDVCTKLL